MRPKGLLMWAVAAACSVVLVLLLFRPHQAPKISHSEIREQDFVKLSSENKALKSQIESLETMLLAAKKSLAAEPANEPEPKHVGAEQPCDVEKHIHKKFHPQGFREVLDWEAFDSAHVFSWKRTWQVMGHIGNSRLELQQVVQQGLQQLGPAAHLYKWQHGNVRVDQLRGVEYYLDYVLRTPTPNSSLPLFRRISFLRPIMQVLVQEADPAPANAMDETVYLILPLSGRTTMFRSFMKGVLAAIPKHSPPVHIVVVYFAEDTAVDETSRAAVEQLLEFYQHNHGLGFTIKVLMQPFSRGVGLEAGALIVDSRGGHDPLLFFCDVDMKFNFDFLQRCRANAVAGHRIYFPIVFSLYRNKPNVVAAPNGAWRNYGLGMVCVYQSDFKNLGGFSKTITGWGREDVDFYERVVKQGTLEVVRAVDDGIQHIFHDKLCDEGTLTEDQFKDCIGSMADWEGTKVDLGKSIATYRLQIGRLEAQIKELQGQAVVPGVPGAAAAAAPAPVVDQQSDQKEAEAGGKNLQR
eukprot:m.78201 g.78201  ORF g.78201 m.78201 type:complete len:522 (-) comp13241_c0_seq4:28-1593(-)